MTSYTGNLILTTSGLNFITQCGTAGVFANLIYFLPVYDWRIDPNIHSSVGYTSAINLSAAALPSDGDFVGRPYGEIIYNTFDSTATSANEIYTLSNLKAFILSGVPVPITTTTGAGVTYIANTSANDVSLINLLKGRPLTSAASATSAYYDETLAKMVFQTSTFATMSGGNDIPGGFVNVQDKFFRVASYQTKFADANTQRGVYKCVLGPQYGEFKFNKIALYAQKVNSSNVIDTTVPPVLFAEAMLKEPIVKSTSGYSVARFEMDIELQLTSSQTSLTAIKYVNDDYWTRITSAGPGDAGMLHYYGKVGINTLEDNVGPRKKLEVMDADDMQLRLASKAGNGLHYDIGTWANGHLIISGGPDGTHGGTVWLGDSTGEITQAVSYNSVNNKLSLGSTSALTLSAVEMSINNATKLFISAYNTGIDLIYRTADIDVMRITSGGTIIFQDDIALRYGDTLLISGTTNMDNPFDPAIINFGNNTPYTFNPRSGTYKPLTNVGLATFDGFYLELKNPWGDGSGDYLQSMNLYAKRLVDSDYDGIFTDYGNIYPEPFFSVGHAFSESYPYSDPRRGIDIPAGGNYLFLSGNAIIAGDLKVSGNASLGGTKLYMGYHANDTDILPVLSTDFTLSQKQLYIGSGMDYIYVYRNSNSYINFGTNVGLGDPGNSLALWHNNEILFSIETGPYVGGTSPKGRCVISGDLVTQSSISFGKYNLAGDKGNVASINSFTNSLIYGPITTGSTDTVTTYYQANDHNYIKMDLTTTADPTFDIHLGNAQVMYMDSDAISFPKVVTFQVGDTAGTAATLSVSAIKCNTISIVNGAIGSVVAQNAILNTIELGGVGKAMFGSNGESILFRTNRVFDLGSREKGDPTYANVFIYGDTTRYFGIGESIENGGVSDQFTLSNNVTSFLARAGKLYSSDLLTHIDSTTITLTGTTLSLGGTTLNLSAPNIILTGGNVSIAGGTVTINSILTVTGTNNTINCMTTGYPSSFGYLLANTLFVSNTRATFAGVLNSSGLTTIYTLSIPSTGTITMAGAQTNTGTTNLAGATTAANISIDKIYVYGPERTAATSITTLDYSVAATDRLIIANALTPGLFPTSIIRLPVWSTAESGRIITIKKGINTSDNRIRIQPSDVAAGGTIENLPTYTGNFDAYAAFKADGAYHHIVMSTPYSFITLQMFTTGGTNPASFWYVLNHSGYKKDPFVGSRDHNFDGLNNYSTLGTAVNYPWRCL